MNHSPGPWRIVRASDYTDNPEDTAIQSIEAADGTVVYYTESGYFKPNEADVRLIATAPEMREELTKALDWLASYPGSGAIARYDAIRALLARIDNA